MDRKKKLYLNTVTALLFQVLSLISGFILPRLFLTNYGTDVNGLVSSITHLLGFFSLAECGMGAVVQSSLFEPLAKRDSVQVSKIMRSARRFFNVVAYILIAYILALCILYPLIVRTSFSPLFTILLLLAMSISYFAQYYFGITYKLLLQADQMAYVQYTVSGVALILNVVASFCLVRLGCSIQLMKLVSSILFLLQPMLLFVYVRKKYEIDRNITYTEEPIKQKWNGMAQHIATVVLNNADTTVLTVFSTLANVSVYSVYHLVVGGMVQLLTSVSVGVKAWLGNIYYSEDRERLLRSFREVEWFMHFVTTLLFGVTLALIVPFVQVYTGGISDATQYIVPTFAVVITLAQTMYCIRLPYSLMIQAAGHYKQTQLSAIMEAAINVVVSIALVFRWGLVGIAIGTLAAMSYRTVYLAFYLGKNILACGLRSFVKCMLVDALSMLAMQYSTKWITLSTISYIGWIKMAVTIFVICFAELSLINVLFDFEQIRSFLLWVRTRNGKKRGVSKNDDEKK